MEQIVRKNIEEELKNSYLTYAMSVNTNRAIPDVRDGLKPSTRRIIYAMGQMNLTNNRPYDKCAAIVGEVMKNYHPHGDAAIYATLVGLEQSFVTRYPLVDGQGNFGSIDDDPPGAMRYTECRMEKITDQMLVDINKEVVDFQPNYKDSIDEPTVLPALLPNLLVNGTTGIGVGYLTKIPPHNLSEVIDALLAKIENVTPMTTDELLEYIPGPDFPTGGTIVGKDGIKDIYEKGRGGITVRAKVSIERSPVGKNTFRDKIVITEIPFQVKKNQLLDKIYQLVVSKTITGISDIRDESDKDIRVVIDLKKGEVPQVIVNQLYKHTPMQTRFNAIMLCLVNGLPEILSLDQILEHYLDHRKEVIRRRTQFDLDKAEKRAHILLGYLIAQDHLDEIIALIRESDTPNSALDILQNRYNLSEIQAREILSMTLRQLTKLEYNKVETEYKEIKVQIKELSEILGSSILVDRIIKKELKALKKTYSDERRTEITDVVEDFQVEDLIADEQVVVTVTHNGYIKRMPSEAYKKQKRGGTGSKGLNIKENDFVEHIVPCTAHEHILFFTNVGKCYGLKVFEIPEGSKQAAGRSIVNLLPKMGADEVISAFIPIKDFQQNKYIFMGTQNGIVKKCDLNLFARPTKAGVRAIKLIDEDELVDVQLVSPNQTVLLLTRKGHYTRFKELDIKSVGRNTQGLKAIRLFNNDKVIQMITEGKEDESILLITETGYAKRSELKHYTTKKRGAKSVKAISDASGNVVASKIVTDQDELFILNTKGNVSRIPVKGIPLQGRTAQGVRIMKLQTNEKVVDVGRISG